VVLLGGDRLASAVHERLVAIGGASVRVVPAAKRRAEPDPTALDGASVVVLADDDDAGNVDLALAIRRRRPDLPLVVRLFDAALGDYLKSTLSQTTVLSMSALAAPVFADAALRAAGSRGAVARADKGPARARARRVARARRWPDRVLLSALAGLLLLVVLAAFFFSHALGLPFIDALYFVCTTVTTVGYGDIALKDAPVAVKIVGILLMLSGTGFVAVLLAVLTDWVVSRRLDVLRGHVRVRGRGHVVVAGCGNVGFRVAGLLRTQGHRVVVIERAAESRHVAALRDAGHHVIIADAAGAYALDLARVDDACVILALTDAQATNLHIALAVQARGAGTPVVIKAASPQLSAHVSQRKDAIAISPIDVAADEFARAALAAR
jgi:voltage-gated potassium channel Kch